MSDGYKPTLNFRWREEIAPNSAGAIRAPGLETADYRARYMVLEQRFVSVYVGKPDQWREVPIVGENGGQTMRCEDCGQKECCGADPKKAAADDLYEALSGLLQAYNRVSPAEAKPAQAARAALAKARGQS